MATNLKYWRSELWPIQFYKITKLQSFFGNHVMRSPIKMRSPIRMRSFVKKRPLVKMRSCCNLHVIREVARDNDSRPIMLGQILHSSHSAPQAPRHRALSIKAKRVLFSSTNQHSSDIVPHRSTSHQDVEAEVLRKNVSSKPT